MPIKNINAVADLARFTIDGQVYTFVRTQNPSNPRLYTTCQEPVDAWLNRRRIGQMTPHGKKWWVPELDDAQSPTVCAGDTFMFVSSPPCPDDSPCNYWLAETGTRPPSVEWNSLMHQCSEEMAPDALAAGNEPAGGWGVGDPPQAVQMNVRTRYGGLQTNGTSVNLPDYGSFAAYYSISYGFTFGSSQPISWLQGANGVRLTEPTQPYDPSQGSCAGQARMLKRRPVEGIGGALAVVAQSPTGSGNTFAIQPGAFIVMWFDT